MCLYERYLAGETLQVYNEIEGLGEKAFAPEFASDVENVLSETFERVAFNLDLIVEALKEMDYKFKLAPEEIYKPGGGTDQLLEQLKSEVSQFGHLPLSVYYFYKHVGGANLVWDVDQYPEIPWKLADPLEIDSLDVLAGTVKQEWWKNYIEENLKDPQVGMAFVEVAADRFHKDNIEGGPPYAIQITKEPAIDSPFLFSHYNTSFINYLRNCFDKCGFPGVEIEDELFKGFREGVGHRLMKF